MFTGRVRFSVTCNAFCNGEIRRKMKKIDIHCHVLPKLDDGSASLQESIRMLKLACRQGIQAVVATPHDSHQFRQEDPEKIRNLCRRLETRARAEVNPDFRVYPGEEIFYSQETLEKLKRNQLLTIGESRYLLIEFMPNVPYSLLYRAVRELTEEQYRPILAHMERYGVLREKGRVEELVKAGACMQMNYRRIGGRWYDETVRWCRKMLKNQKVHFLATDMHNTKSRRPQTQEAEAWMEKHLERTYIEEIAWKNQEKILRPAQPDGEMDILHY